MKKCMGSITNVPGCDGTNNTTPEKQAQQKPNQPKIDLAQGGAIAAVGLQNPHDIRQETDWLQERATRRSHQALVLVRLPTDLCLVYHYRPNSVWVALALEGYQVGGRDANQERHHEAAEAVSKR